MRAKVGGGYYLLALLGVSALIWVIVGWAAWKLLF
jgi:hypothetical protein